MLTVAGSAPAHACCPGLITKVLPSFTRKVLWFVLATACSLVIRENDLWQDLTDPSAEMLKGCGVLARARASFPMGRARDHFQEASGKPRWYSGWCLERGQGRQTWRRRGCCPTHPSTLLEESRQKTVIKQLDMLLMAE